MSIKRVGYNNPSGMAGIMGSGKSNFGGIKIPPKFVIFFTVGLIIVILIAKLAGI